MVSFYSIVQYVPDPGRDERINIGVVAFSDADDRVRAHFLGNWQRVRQFGAGVPGLQKAARAIEVLNRSKMIREAITASTWLESIQFTEPAPSVLDVDLLLFDAATRFLIDPPVREKPYRNRKDAVGLTKAKLQGALTARVGRPGQTFLKTGYRLGGRLDKRGHKFDVALVNGSPLMTADSLSFEVPYGLDLEKNVKATEWAVRDVKEADDSISVAVVMLPPKSTGSAERDLFDRTVETLSLLRVEAVTESELDGWAAGQAERVAAYVKNITG